MGIPMRYNDDTAPIPFVKALLKFFSNQVNVNWPDSYPLRSAVRAGHAPLIRLLLRAGANPLGGSSSKESALKLAIQLRSLSLVKLLLEEGESWLDSENNEELGRHSLPTSFLTQAHERNAPEIVFYLIEERNMVPTVEILKWLAEQETDLRPGKSATEVPESR